MRRRATARKALRSAFSASSRRRHEMSRSAKTYIYAVIGAGGCVLAWSGLTWSHADPLLWALFSALAILASVVKLRLPGMEGTYSLNFLFLLYGVAHFPLA